MQQQYNRAAQRATTGRRDHRCHQAGVARRSRPLPFHGPYLRSLPAWDGELERYRWMLFSPDDYGLLMARRWRLDHAGYPCTYVWNEVERKSILLYAHRLVARAPADRWVDHRHHDILDVRRSQLRLCTPSENAANARRIAISRTKLVPYRGVTIHKKTGKFQAAAKYRDRFIHLGLFTDPVEAAKAYDAKARELWGQFAITNTYDDDTTGVAA